MRILPQAWHRWADGVGLRLWLERAAIVVAIICVVVAIINRLALVRWLGRPETLLSLAAVALLAAIYLALDEHRAR